MHEILAIKTLRQDDGEAKVNAVDIARTYLNKLLNGPF